jgi:quercetin dioxygenase-like cupin family protein
MKTFELPISQIAARGVSGQMESAETDPSKAPLLRAFGQEMLVLLSREQTGGRCTVLLDSVPPDLGTPPHYHEREDELFYVLEGRAAFWLGGTWREVPVGSTVFAPRKAPHGFKNVGASPLRVLITLTPSGFEKWFARCALEFDGTDSPNMERLTSLAAEHGMYFPAPVAALRTQPDQAP